MIPFSAKVTASQQGHALAATGHVFSKGSIRFHSVLRGSLRAFHETFTGDLHARWASLRRCQFLIAGVEHIEESGPKRTHC